MRIHRVRVVRSAALVAALVASASSVLLVGGPIATADGRVPDPTTVDPDPFDNEPYADSTQEYGRLHGIQFNACGNYDLAKECHGLPGYGVTAIRSARAPVLSVSGMKVTAKLPGTRQFKWVYKVPGQADFYFTAGKVVDVSSRGYAEGTLVRVNARKDSNVNAPWSDEATVVIGSDSTGFSRGNVRWSWTGNFFGTGSDAFYDRALTSGIYEGVAGMNMKHIREDREMIDANFVEAAARGAKVLPVLGESVLDDATTLADSTRDFIRRYGHKGTFWQAGQPGAPYAGRNLEVDWIEWINEPYVSCMGAADTGLSAAPLYAQLVKTAYQRLKGYPEGARVKIGIGFDLTLYDCEDGGSGSGDFIPDMVNGNGGVAGVPDFFSSGGYYDAITIHPYGDTTCAQTERWCFMRVKEIIARIDSVDGSTGAHGKDIWFTEDGAGTEDQLGIYQRQVEAMENDSELQELPVRGWSWHHYLDYAEWDQGLTVNGYLDTRKPTFAWVRDNLANQTPPHNYEGN